MILEHIEILHSLNIFSITLRIFLALILGGALGLEREQKQRPAGFRTYMIVCVGSALACITNLYMVEALNASDPARIPAQVISGIGFLGAGTILDSILKSDFYNRHRATLRNPASLRNKV